MLSELIQKHYRSNVIFEQSDSAEQKSMFRVYFANVFFGQFEVEGTDRKKNKKRVAFYILSQLAPQIYLKLNPQ